MKTEISIPDCLFEAADRLASHLGMSRNELYSTAVSQYLDQNRALGVRERLDAVYTIEPEAYRIDPAVHDIQSASILDDQW